MKLRLLFLLLGIGAQLVADSYEDEEEERDYENRQYENRQQQNEYDERQYENQHPPPPFTPQVEQRQLLMQEELEESLLGIER